MQKPIYFFLFFLLSGLVGSVSAQTTFDVPDVTIDSIYIDHFSSPNGKTRMAVFMGPDAGLSIGSHNSCILFGSIHYFVFGTSVDLSQIGLNETEVANLAAMIQKKAQKALAMKKRISFDYEITSNPIKSGGTVSDCTITTLVLEGEQ